MPIIPLLSWAGFSYYRFIKKNKTQAAITVAPGRAQAQIVPGPAPPNRRAQAEAAQLAQPHLMEHPWAEPSPSCKQGSEPQFSFSVGHKKDSHESQTKSNFSPQRLWDKLCYCSSGLPIPCQHPWPWHLPHGWAGAAPALASHRNRTEAAPPARTNTDSAAALVLCFAKLSFEETCPELGMPFVFFLPGQGSDVVPSFPRVFPL